MNKLFVVAFCFLGAALAHLCIQTPPQRLGFPAAALTSVGIGQCFLLNGPCGNYTKGAAVANYTLGETFVGTLVMNEQHFNATSPGYLYWAYCTGTNCTYNENFKPLGVNFTDSASYTAPVAIKSNLTIPSTAATGPAVIQAVYQTWGKDVYSWPEWFYMCSDVNFEAAAPSPSSASTVFASVALIVAAVALF